MIDPVDPRLKNVTVVFWRFALSEKTLSCIWHFCICLDAESGKHVFAALEDRLPPDAQIFLIDTRDPSEPTIPKKVERQILAYLNNNQPAEMLHYSPNAYSR